MLLHCVIFASFTLATATARSQCWDCASASTNDSTIQDALGNIVAFRGSCDTSDMDAPFTVTTCRTPCFTLDARVLLSVGGGPVGVMEVTFKGCVPRQTEADSSVGCREFGGNDPLAAELSEELGGFDGEIQNVSGQYCVCSEDRCN